MKKPFFLYNLIYLLHFTVFSQITATEDTWKPIGNTKIDLRFDDADNGDGLNDGALDIDGLDTNGPLGVLYAFQGTMQNGELYSIKTNVYNYKSSYIKYTVELYNVTDNSVLSKSPVITIYGGDTTVRTTSISYTATTTDAGDKLQLRYVRENTAASNHTPRDFAIDNASLNDTDIKINTDYFEKPILDILAVQPTTDQLAEMDLILNKLSDYFLGSTPPTPITIDEAIAQYNNLNIITTSTSITGTMPTVDWNIEVWKTAAFLKVFAQYLKYNPTSSTVYNNGLTLQEMASNTVWFYCDQFRKGKIPRDSITYFYKLFAAPSIFLKPYFNTKVNELFYYSLIKHSVQYKYFWESEYLLGRRYIGSQGAINIDDIGNMSAIQLAFGQLQNTPEERLQWTKGFKRYYERFMSYTPGTSDGIKSDGSAFHHRSALNNYTYNYNTPMFVLSILDGTSFQVSKEAYKVFRKAIYTQLFVANDDMEPLAMSGRHPEARKISPNKDLIRLTAITGGHILDLPTPDPVLANAYVRHWGKHEDLPDATFEMLSGFKPLNYHGAGIFWKDNYMVAVRGQSNWSFGAEKVREYQHYGRYQSYGALEIIYPKGHIEGNGFKFKGWNWNFSPGTTSILLPWNLLQSENVNQKEYQKKGFVGSLSLERQNHSAYTSMGKTGVFAMDFSESETNWGYHPIRPNTHNPSFVFKKSVFFFEDYILALGSNINNNDNSHPTITTLFQRLSENQANITVNGTVYNAFGSTTFTNSNWLIDNFNTGYYVVAENGNQVQIQRKKQKVPFLTDFDYTLCESRPPVDYSIGYINHGKKPMNASYEFVIKPNVTTSKMSSFAEKMSNGANKPYQVLQKDEKAHIVKDRIHKTVGFSLFSSNDNLPENLLVKSNDKPCLIMYKKIKNKVRLSLSNPDMGFFIDSFVPSVEVPIQIVLNGKWELKEIYNSVSLVDITDETTTLEFNTFDGKSLEIEMVKFGSKQDDGDNIVIYPNPTQNKIKILTFSKVQSTVVYNMRGQLLFANSTTDNSVDVSSLILGNYILKIITEDGVFYKKFVKY